MSVRIMTAVWSVHLPDSEKIVLLALADCANDEGLCWPSMTTLAAKCSKSDRTVQAAIKSLVASGHMSRHEVPGKGCRYVIHPAPEAASPPKSLRGETAAPPKRTTPTPEAASDKPSRTTIPKKDKPSSKKRVRKAPGFALPSDIPASEWRDFEEMRRVMRKPMTNSIREKCVARLRKLAEDGWPPGEVLSHSTLNNYQGLFPPKDDRNGNRTERRMDGEAGVRGSRPDPALDLLNAARRAEEAERAGGSGPDYRGTRPALPAFEPG